MLKDFQEFINRGSVVDLAVAVVIGAAFGAIVTSLVQHIIMPPVGALFGGLDFSEYGVILRGADQYASVPEAIEAGAPVLQYGAFINAVINFLIIAAAIFLAVRSYNNLQERFKREKEETPADEPPAKTYQEELLEEIRDALAKSA